METMKAIIHTKYGPPEVLKIEEIEKPIPKDNEILIKIHAAAINSTDPTMRSGKPFISRIGFGLLKPKKKIPGDVFSGEIEEVGVNMKSFKKGDQIYGSANIGLGAHAEYICLPEDGAFAIKPSNYSFEESAAICDGALTALPFLRDKGKIQSGQKVLIYGASGSIGTFAVQLAKHYGSEVTGVCSTTNLDLVKSLGADHVIDYTKEDFTKNGEAYDIIFDTVAKKTYSKCKKSLTEHGIYLNTFPSVALLIQMLWTSKIGNKKAIFSATGLRTSSKKAKDLDILREIIEKGNIRSVIDRRYSMENIAEAHTYVETGHKKGNVVLSIHSKARSNIGEI